MRWGHTEEPWIVEPSLEELQGWALAENHSGDKTAPKQKVTAVGQSQQIMGVMVTPHWAGKEERQGKDYSQALRAHEICTIVFSVSLGPVTPSFFSLFPFGK